MSNQRYSNIIKVTYSVTHDVWHESEFHSNSHFFLPIEGKGARNCWKPIEVRENPKIFLREVNSC
jgi:hypothetical protein